MLTATQSSRSVWRFAFAIVLSLLYLTTSCLLSPGGTKAAQQDLALFLLRQRSHYRIAGGTAIAVGRFATHARPRGPFRRFAFLTFRRQPENRRGTRLFGLSVLPSGWW